MKKLYYRCEDGINELLEEDAIRQHITKNQLIDRILRQHFSLKKSKKKYKKANETEKKILGEIIEIGADIMDISETLEIISSRNQFNDELLNLQLKAMGIMLDIESKLKKITTMIRELS